MRATIGTRDARITIQRATESIDDEGSVSHTWATLGNAWAAVQDIETKGSTSEETTEGTRQAFAESVFSIRFQSTLSDLNPKDRITWAGGVYDISSALLLPPARPSEIIITATRIAD